MAESSSTASPNKLKIGGSKLSSTSHKKKVSNENKRIEESIRYAETSDAEPMDMLIIRRILLSMGAQNYEENVVHQISEFLYRTASDILKNAKEYAVFAGKAEIEEDDIKLALQTKTNSKQFYRPSREMLLSLSEQKNSIPMPSIPSDTSLYVPPEHQQFHYAMQKPGLDTLQEEILQEDVGQENKMKIEVLDEKNMAKGTWNKTIAKNQIPIKLSNKSVPQTADATMMDSIKRKIDDLKGRSLSDIKKAKMDAAENVPNVEDTKVAHKSNTAEDTKVEMKKEPNPTSFATTEKTEQTEQTEIQFDVGLEDGFSALNDITRDMKDPFSSNW